MLQAQINPHFLFNVLNSIRMKVMRGGDQESAKMIASLSKLLRMTISRDEDAITLHEEIELLTHYVEANEPQAEGKKAAERGRGSSWFSCKSSALHSSAARGERVDSRLKPECWNDPD